MADETGIGGPRGDFPETRWTLILSARAGAEPRQKALSELLATYWKPLYFHCRRKGLDVEAAKDAIQGFCAHLLERDFLERLDPSKGRFRAYLKTALDHYLVNLHESRSALKRGGGVRTVPLDFDVAEGDLPSAPEAPEAACDREWALGVMERSLAELRREFEAGHRRGPFEVALRFFQLGEAPSHPDAATRSGMSAAQFKAFLHRTRARFRHLVRQEVAQTVADPADVEAEMADLLRALAP